VSVTLPDHFSEEALPVLMDVAPGGLTKYLEGPSQ
jgi:hypothetical protein